MSTRRGQPIAWAASQSEEVERERLRGSILYTAATRELSSLYRAYQRGITTEDEVRASLNTARQQRQRRETSI